ncbi:MAG: hypothetical protein LBN95_03675 [Prevotellaceae bacterium]|jgi:hypothetical protein|nr:hypothetical protein [Prevotellaceae bacterium]
MLPFQGANGGWYQLPNALHWAEIYLAFSQKLQKSVKFFVNSVPFFANFTLFLLLKNLYFYHKFNLRKSAFYLRYLRAKKLKI